MISNTKRSSYIPVYFQVGRNHNDTGIRVTDDGYDFIIDIHDYRENDFLHGQRPAQVIGLTKRFPNESEWCIIAKYKDTIDYILCQYKRHGLDKRLYWSITPAKTSHPGAVMHQYVDLFSVDKSDKNGISFYEGIGIQKLGCLYITPVNTKTNLELLGY